MVFSFGIQIRLMRFFRRIVIAYAPRFFVYGYVCPPFVLKAYNAQKTRFVSFVRFTNVLRVAIFKYFTQIFKPIIRLNPVYMVYKFNWPFTCHIKPCQLVRAVNVFIYSNSNVPNTFLNATRNGTNFRTLSNPHFPNKNTCVRIVIQHFAQTVMRKVKHLLHLSFNNQKTTTCSSFCKGQS